MKIEILITGRGKKNQIFTVLWNKIGDILESLQIHREVKDIGG